VAYLSHIGGCHGHAPREPSFGERTRRTTRTPTKFGRWRQTASSPCPAAFANLGVGFRATDLALDALWETLQETRGLGAATDLGRVCAPTVRTARVRDLVKWNDHPGQTKANVLALLDSTLARLATAEESARGQSAPSQVGPHS
jgi:hypothetical protein